jgi:hypothetical protein
MPKESSSAKVLCMGGGKKMQENSFRSTFHSFFANVCLFWLKEVKRTTGINPEDTWRGLYLALIHRF